MTKYVGTDKVVKCFNSSFPQTHLFVYIYLDISARDPIRIYVRENNVLLRTARKISGKSHRHTFSKLPTIFPKHLKRVLNRVTGALAAFAKPTFLTSLSRVFLGRSRVYVQQLSCTKAAGVQKEREKKERKNKGRKRGKKRGVKQWSWPRRKTILAVIVARAGRSVVSLFSCSSCTVGSRGGPEEL